MAFADIITGASLLSTAATGKGATEIALDMMTGQDCRLLEGVLREDRDFCEDQGSAATEEDFKGLVAWLEDNEPEAPLPDDQTDSTIMVAEIGPPDTAINAFSPLSAESAAARTDLPTAPRPVALASLTDLPREWIILASAEYGPEAANLNRLKSGDAPLPFLPDRRAPSRDLADWALEKSPATPSDAMERALTLPVAPTKDERVWNNLWPAVDIVNPPPQQDAAALFLPAPAKPALRASLPDRLKNARVESDSPDTAG